MEVIEIEVGEFTRRRRSVSVPHSVTGLRRGLELDEEVLVLADGEFRSASVAGVEFSLEDTHYLLALGGLVPADLAAERAAGTAVADRDLHEVVDLLGAGAVSPVVRPQRRGSSTS